MTTRACENCGTEFTARTKRQTCSDSCKVSLGWKNMSAERREQRLNTMSDSATKNQSGTKLNRMRWARPGERERTAEQNRERWSDSDYNARVSAAIAAAHATPEVQKRLSAASIRRWQNPRYRENCLASMIAAHRTQSYRDLMSAIRSAQWRDPVYRARGLAAIMRRRDAQRAMMLRRGAAIRSQFSNNIAPRPPLVRPPATTQPPVRPAMPEPSRGFSMMDGRTARPERQSWRRLDLVL